MSNERDRVSGSDEIDLIELVQGIWRQKYWALMVGMPILIAGIAYALLATPIYEAKLYVQPPSQNYIAQLNYGRGGGTELEALTVKDVYEVYLRALQSEAVRNKFFRAVYLPSLSEKERGGSRDGMYSEFNTKLKVGLAAKSVPTRYVITASVDNPQWAANWVSIYAEMAAEDARQEVLKGSKSEMQVKADNIERQLVAAKASARKEREDQIAQLKEALVVAKSIGLERPPLISSNLSTELSAGLDGSLSYMRGSRALEAEISNLESRSTDEPFIKGLRKKQETMLFYRNVILDPSGISVYQQDGIVELPDKPVKPRRVVIVVLSAVLAVGFGMLAALGRMVWLRRGAKSL